MTFLESYPDENTSTFWKDWAFLPKVLSSQDIYK